jgi:hypothetical protein
VLPRQNGDNCPSPRACCCDGIRTAKNPADCCARP